MAEDIHQKIFVKSKITGKYISAAELQFSMTDDMFQDLFGNIRNYDLFSVFGSRRGSFKAIEATGYGIPKWLKEDMPTEYALHSSKDMNWYSYTVFSIADLRERICKYLVDLQDPITYFDKDSDEYNDAIDGNFDEIYPYWTKDAANLSEALNNILNKVVALQDNYKTYNSIYAPLFDLETVRYLFWFDS